MWRHPRVGPNAILSLWMCFLFFSFSYILKILIFLMVRSFILLNKNKKFACLNVLGIRPLAPKKKQKTKNKKKEDKIQWCAIICNTRSIYNLDETSLKTSTERLGACLVRVGFWSENENKWYLIVWLRAASFSFWFPEGERRWKYLKSSKIIPWSLLILQLHSDFNFNSNHESNKSGTCHFNSHSSLYANCGREPNMPNQPAFMCLSPRLK